MNFAACTSFLSPPRPFVHPSSSPPVAALHQLHDVHQLLAKLLLRCLLRRLFGLSVHLPLSLRLLLRVKWAGTPLRLLYAISPPYTRAINSMNAWMARYVQRMPLAHCTRTAEGTIEAMTTLLTFLQNGVRLLQRKKRQ